MSHPKTGANRLGMRLVKTAVTSAFAASAVAGGVMLSGSSARAAAACPPSGVSVGDVTITCIPDAGYVKEPVGATAVELQNPITNYFDVDADITPDLTVPGTYKFDYDLKTISGAPFLQAQLDSNITLGSGGPIVITKEIYDKKGGTLLTTLTSTNGSNTGFINIPGTPSSIYVLDTVNFPAGTVGLVDNYRNTFYTPGPLPVLGAGAAFGFSRKLRGRIKAARTA